MMGFVDNNMVQTKSMNVVSSGSENDDVRKPEYKRRRRVYGVRHFPPGCGPRARSNVAVSVAVSGVSTLGLENGAIVVGNDDPVGVCVDGIEANEVPVHLDSRPDDSVLSSDDIVNPGGLESANNDCSGVPAYGIESRVSTVSLELDDESNVGHHATTIGSDDLRLSGSLGQMDIGEQTDNVESKGDIRTAPPDYTNGLTLESPESTGSSLSETLELENNSFVCEPVKLLQDKATGVSKGSSEVDVSAPPKITSMCKYPPRRKMLGVRDFPPNCGRNAKPLDKEEEENIGDLIKRVKNDGEKVKDVYVIAGADEEQLESNVLEQNNVTVDANAKELIEEETLSPDEVVSLSVDVARADQECERDRGIRSLHNHIQIELGKRFKVVHNSDRRGDSKGHLHEGQLESNVLEQNIVSVDTMAKEFIEKAPRSPDEVVSLSVDLARVDQECERDRGVRSPHNRIQNELGKKSKVVHNSKGHLHEGQLESNVLEQKSVSVDTMTKEFIEKATRSPDEDVSCFVAVARVDQECERDRGIRSPHNRLQSELGENSKVVHNSNRQGDPKEHLQGDSDVRKAKIAAQRKITKLSILKKITKKECGGLEVTTNSSEKSNKKKEVIAREHRKSASMAREKSSLSENTDGSLKQEAVSDALNDVENGEKCNGLRRRTKFSVNITPFGPGSSKSFDSARKKVRETLRLFHFICRKLVHEAEARSKKGGSQIGRVDQIAAKELRSRGMCLNEGRYIVGAFPGVEVGDEFQFRLELNVIGLHRQIQGGIDFVKQGQDVIAVSIVASAGYDDNLDNSDVLDYTGQGGNSTKDKEAEDQKLEKGNLALKNSITMQNPVRVIRGYTKISESAEVRSSKVYVYDGLYNVEKFRQEPGPHGKLVFKFRMVRIPGQPELAWKQVKKSKKLKLREGLCVSDISQGKELIPISAVNRVDNEKPPSFKYITQIMYPDTPTPPNGCNCRNGCSESGSCSCVAKNGGEIPFNNNGAIVEAKGLVYECGPSCKCPPSCYNRVSQQGIKIQLEVFKTDSRGWGVRSLNSISSGSFICEYVGELLDDNEAERRTNDEYLFDIGGCSDDDSEGNGSPGFTIDAAVFGNVGRFINHSCSPNLYAQNVLYDHGDRRIPHIMLFAAENIPPLRELTYHYNYQIDQVRDSQGNIKMKSCYCGSSECTGRMY